MVSRLGKQKHREVTPQQLDAMLRANAPVVVARREVDEFAAGHNPGDLSHRTR